MYGEREQMTYANDVVQLERIASPVVIMNDGTVCDGVVGLIDPTARLHEEEHSTVPACVPSEDCTRDQESQKTGIHNEVQPASLHLFANEFTDNTSLRPLESATTSSASSSSSSAPPVHQAMPIPSSSVTASDSYRRITGILTMAIEQELEREREKSQRHERNMSTLRHQMEVKETRMKEMQAELNRQGQLIKNSRDELLVTDLEKREMERALTQSRRETEQARRDTDFTKARLIKTMQSLTEVEGEVVKLRSQIKARTDTTTTPTTPTTTTTMKKCKLDFRDSAYHGPSAKERNRPQWAGQGDGAAELLAAARREAREARADVQRYRTQIADMQLKLNQQEQLVAEMKVAVQEEQSANLLKAKQQATHKESQWKLQKSSTEQKWKAREQQLKVQLKRERDKAADRIKVLEERIQQQQTSSQEQMRLLERRLQEDMLEVKRECEMIADEFIEQTKRVQEERAKAEVEVRILRERITEAAGGSDRADDAVQQLRKDLEAAHEKANRLADALKQAEVEAARMTERASAAARQCEQLQGQASESAEENQALRREVDDLISTHRKATEDMKREAKARLAKETKLRQRLKEELTSANKLIAKMRRKMARRNELISKLDSEIGMIEKFNLAYKQQELLQDVNMASQDEASLRNTPFW